MTIIDDGAYITTLANTSSHRPAFGGLHAYKACATNRAGGGNQVSAELIPMGAPEASICYA